MTYLKFIIEDGNLIMGKCTFHKELACVKENVKGGGWFRHDERKESYVLGGDSYEFGYAEIDDLKECIRLGNVYRNPALVGKIENKKFLYHTGSEFIELN